MSTNYQLKRKYKTDSVKGMFDYTETNTYWEQMEAVASLKSTRKFKNAIK